MLVRVGLVAVNLTPGDLDGNLDTLCGAYNRAAEAGCDLVVFPELAISGYPPEDLVLRDDFLTECRHRLDSFAAHVSGPAALVGFPEQLSPHPVTDARDRSAANAAAWIEHREIIKVSRKRWLPNYSVFDEARVFAPAPLDQEPTVTLSSGLCVGGLICEDLWRPGPLDSAAALGARLVVVANASPYTLDKPRARRKIVAESARRVTLPVLYANLVGGIDEVVFDGRNLAADATGAIRATGSAFQEEVLVLDVETDSGTLEPQDRILLAQPTPFAPKLHTSQLPPATDSDSVRTADPTADPDLADLYQALLVGLRDYTAKNDFDRVWVGLSGGIDSALVATLAVDALGPASVFAIAMPGPFSSPGSVTDAHELARRTGISIIDVPISDMVQAADDALFELFGDMPRDVTEENIQARMRGLVLMAASNKLSGLVLSTGNKSETSVGFCTLYGDTNGGLAPLKDIPKTLVYALCRWRNAQAGTKVEPIPRAIIDKAPSAELAENQHDESALGSYDALDAVLAAYIEHDASPQAIVTSTGLPASYITKICNLVDHNEYKRRQGPPGIKVTDKAFGRDRRLPITNRWRPTAANIPEEAPVS